MVQTFADRFTYNNPTFATLADNIDSLTEEQLASLSPELLSMAQMVRRFSVLTTNVTLREVYFAVTLHADPEIALVLAAAKNEDGTFRYGNTAVLKSFMFGPGTDTGTQFVNATNNIFVEGIRRVSASLAAALLIQKFSQISEQFEHGQALQEKAMADLDRILQMPDLDDQAVAAQREELQRPRIYFTPADLSAPIQFRIFIPGSVSSGVLTFDPTISSQPNTGGLVNAISDALNAQVITSTTQIGSLDSLQTATNIVAAPVLAGRDLLHYVEFIPRAAVLDQTAEVVTISFEGGDTPFTWGVDPQSLTNEPTNSALVVVQNTRFTAPAQIAEVADALRFVPTVLYIRQIAGATVPTTTDEIRFRIGLTEDIYTVPMNQGTRPDTERPSIFAERLLDQLHEIKAETRLLGAIIRNDPITQTVPTQPTTVLELISWAVGNPETFRTMDILTVPADLEVALGDYNGVWSAFSNLPRTLRVPNQYSRFFGEGTLPTPQNAGGKPKVTPLGRSTLWQSITDQSDAINTRYYR